MNPFSTPPMNLAKRWKVSVGAEIITCGEAIDNVSSFFMEEEQKKNLKKVLLDPNTTVPVLEGYIATYGTISPDLAECLRSIIRSKQLVAVDPITNVPPVGGNSGGASSSSSAVPIVLGVVGAGAAIYLLTRKH